MQLLKLATMFPKFCESHFKFQTFALIFTEFAVGSMGDETALGEMDKIFFPRQPKRRKIIRVHHVSNEEDDSKILNDSSDFANDTMFPKYITDYKGKKLLVHWLQSDEEKQKSVQQPQVCNIKIPENAENKECNGTIEIDTSHEEETKHLMELTELTTNTDREENVSSCVNVCFINERGSSDATIADENVKISKDVGKESQDNSEDNRENSSSVSENESINHENWGNVENSKEETVPSQLQNILNDE